MEKIISKLFKSKIENNHNLDSSTQANNLLVISLMCHITKTYHIHKHVYNIYIYIYIYVYIYVYIYIYIVLYVRFSLCIEFYIKKHIFLCKFTKQIS